MVEPVPVAASFFAIQVARRQFLLGALRPSGLRLRRVSVGWQSAPRFARHRPSPPALPPN